MNKSMICHICVENGLKSTIFIGVTTTTTAYFQPFYDENGVYHHHDENKTTTNLTCSNGHKFALAYKSGCPSYPKNCEFAPEEFIVIK